MAKQKVSTQTIDEALKIAKGTARPGQTKEQTKAIAQGIEKGIAEYKKREKAKARERDKLKKKAQREQDGQTSDPVAEVSPQKGNKLPWVLLGVSWSLFVLYVFWSIFM